MRSIRSATDAISRVQTSQTDMERLWREYEEAVNYARNWNNTSLGTRLGVRNPNWHDYLNPFSILDNDAQTDNYLRQELERVQDVRVAQQLRIGPA